MAPSPGLHLQCIPRDFSGLTVQPDTYDSVCLMEGLWVKMKNKTVRLLKQPEEFPHYPACLINQAFLIFFVTYIMHNAIWKSVYE